MITLIKNNLIKLLQLIAFTILITGCTPKFEYIYPSIEDSNQFLIETVISNLDISKELEGKVSTNYNIAVLSIENNITLDKPIIAMIEDQIITNLINNDFKVLERDYDAIENLIREGKENYSITVNNLSNNNPNDLNQDIKFIDTKLQSAGIIISYRILEAGMIIREFKEDNNYSIRDALVRLHIRIHKTSNGEIIHANNISSTLSDTINSSLVNQLSSFHYSFFSFSNPLQKKDKKVTDEKFTIANSITSESSSFAILPKFGFGLNFNSGFGINMGGSVLYNTNKVSSLGLDIAYLIPSNNHTLSISGYYQRNIFKKIFLKSGFSYLKTGDLSNIGFIIGSSTNLKLIPGFIMQPSAEISFGSLDNNIMSVNLNIGKKF